MRGLVKDFQQDVTRIKGHILTSIINYHLNNLRNTVTEPHLLLNAFRGDSIMGSAHLRYAGTLIG